jgi:hypothetical protein
MSPTRICWGPTKAVQSATIKEKSKASLGMMGKKTFSSVFLNCGVTDSHDLATGSEVDIDIFLLKKRRRRRVSGRLDHRGVVYIFNKSSEETNAAEEFLEQKARCLSETLCSILIYHALSMLSRSLCHHFHMYRTHLKSQPFFVYMMYMIPLPLIHQLGQRDLFIVSESYLAAAGWSELGQSLALS